MIKRLKYVSRAKIALSPEAIDNLVNQAAEFNEKSGITGALMTAGGMYFQVIEGSPEAIDILFTRIQEDPRHKDVLLLDETFAEERLFPNWSMRKIDLGQESEYKLEPLRSILESIVLQRNNIERLADTLERGIWHIFIENE